MVRLVRAHLVGDLAQLKCVFYIVDNIVKIAIRSSQFAQPKRKKEPLDLYASAFCLHFL